MEYEVKMVSSIYSGLYADGAMLSATQVEESGLKQYPAPKGNRQWSEPVLVKDGVQYKLTHQQYTAADRALYQCWYKYDTGRAVREGLVDAEVAKQWAAHKGTGQSRLSAGTVASAGTAANAERLEDLVMRDDLAIALRNELRKLGLAEDAIQNMLELSGRTREFSDDERKFIDAARELSFEDHLILKKIYEKRDQAKQQQ